MNLDDRNQLRRYNATRQPFGPHSTWPRKLNWYALFLPACLVGGAMLLPALWQIAAAWLRTL